MSPVQLAGFYALLCGASLMVATFFWWHGAAWVLFFSVLELSVVGVAFLAYARRATDCERVVLSGDRLAIRCEDAGRVFSADWPSHWVRVNFDAGADALVVLSVGSDRVCLGRNLRAEWRPQLAEELRWALSGVKVF